MTPHTWWLMRHKLRAAVDEALWRDPWFTSMLPPPRPVRPHGRGQRGQWARDEQERVRAQGGG